VSYKKSQLLTLRKYLVFWWARVAHLFSFLCCIVLFVFVLCLVTVCLDYPFLIASSNFHFDFIYDRWPSVLFNIQMVVKAISSL